MRNEWRKESLMIFLVVHLKDTSGHVVELVPLAVVPNKHASLDQNIIYSMTVKQRFCSRNIQELTKHTYPITPQLIY